MEERKVEEVKIKKEDVSEDTKEIAYESIMHLKHLTEEYIENVHKMSTTYKKEFAICGMGLTLSLTLGPHPVVVTAMGSASSIQCSVMNLMNAITKVKKEHPNG